MRAISLEVHFNRELEPEHAEPAREVFRREVEKVLRTTGSGPGGAWGYGRAYVCGVTIGADAPGALELLRQLHRFLHPERYPEQEHPQGAGSESSLDTLRALASMIDDALTGDPVARTDPNWARS